MLYHADYFRERLVASGGSDLKLLSHRVASRPYPFGQSRTDDDNLPIVLGILLGKEAPRHQT